MTISIDSQLNETLRDALVAYTLHEVVPNAPQFVPGNLNTRIKTANDLYEYLLIDNQVANVVQSSPVASAIASVQQYINAALMGMEPGYDTRVMEEHLITQWRDIQGQYPIWAANQQLRYYPEIYIDPQLRMNKSKYFQQLENDLNQNRINLDTAQDAVKSYLASFEEVANLTVINGYISTDDFKNGMYYFIGRSQGESQYYWRSVDMSQRTLKNINDPNPDGPKFDYPQPGAWSDWHKAELPISASAIEQTIRPVFFNNRLFVFWVELIDQSTQALTVEQSNQPTDPTTPVTTVKANPMLHFNFVYKKYDDSWSVPVTCIKAWSESPLFKTQGVEALVDSVVVYDNSSSPDSMMVMMYAGFTKGGGLVFTDRYEFLKTAHIDKNFNVTPLFPSSGAVPHAGVLAELMEPQVMTVGRLFAHDNKGRFQFPVSRFSTVVTIKKVETESPNINDWNYLGWQAKIAGSVQGLNVKYDSVTRSLEYDSKIAQEFTLPPITTIVKFGEHGEFELTLVTTSPMVGGHQRLLAGSNLKRVLGLNFSTAAAYGFYFVHARGYLRDSEAVEVCTIPALDVGGSFSLEGKLILTSAQEYFINNPGVLTSHTLSAPQGVYYHSFESVCEINDYLFRHVVGRPANLGNFYGAQSRLRVSDFDTKRTPPDTLALSLRINPETLLPDWGQNFPAGSKVIPLVHGVEVQKANTWVGSAFKLTLIELVENPVLDIVPISPRINTRASPTLGVAEFIDFAGSGINMSDDNSAPRQPIRMNTLFARELINKANIALENLLSWETQGLEEPPLDPPAASNLMDFRGANGKYFWELFLHLPFLVSQRMNLELQFDEAERWLGFIFDPARKPDATGRPAYWNVRPLMDAPDLDAVSRAPDNPDDIAASHPVRYRKAVYLHYLKNLQDRGDAAYRQLTPDSLGEAKLWYVRILDLLGPRPDVKLVDHWAPITLKTLADSVSRELRDCEQRLIEQDERREGSAKANNGHSLYHSAEPPLQLRTFTPDLTLADLDSGYLRLPFNQELVKTWDSVESRLRNLRNNRTLDGKALSLPLFAAPLNPRDLLAAFGQGAAAGGAGRLLAQEVPPYRFSVMHQRASAAVDTLIQFGQSLLSMIERKEQAQLQELQQQQLWEFATFAIELQTQAQRVEIEQRKALEASKAVVQGRLDFYRKQADEVVNAGEVAAGALHLAGRIADGVGAVAEAFAGALKVPPNSAGGGGGAVAGTPLTPVAGAYAYVSVGGWRLEGGPQMVAAAAYGLASLSHGSAEAIDRTEQFRRRHQEWMNARNQATLEIAQIDAQLAVLDEQVAATAIQLRQAQAAQDQARATYEFLGKRFSNAQLYQWLNGQFATFYYQAYDATLALCLSAEACWQFEIVDFTSRFIRSGGWNDSRRGLGAGEALKLQLLNMESAYLNRNERLLEITKTISFRRLKAMDPSINQEWAEIQEALLLNDGVVNFELSVRMFEDDYPDTTLRRIRRMGVTLPVALGPFEDVCVTLTQSYNAVEMGGNRWENLRPGQQIVVSHGDNDNGQFIGDDDGRYQPFEGTGVISRWQLRFTEQDLELRHQQIRSLTDIILHLSYTAKASQESPS